MTKSSNKRVGLERQKMKNPTLRTAYKYEVGISDKKGERLVH